MNTQVLRANRLSSSHRHLVTIDKSGPIMLSQQEEQWSTLFRKKNGRKTHHMSHYDRILEFSCLWRLCRRATLSPSNAFSRVNATLRRYDRTKNDEALNTPYIQSCVDI